MEKAQPRLVAPNTQWTGWLPKAAICGLIAGIVMALFVMLATVLGGDDLWLVPRTIAALFAGETYLGDGYSPEPVLIGAGLHLGLSMLFAVIYAFAIGAFTIRVPESFQVVAGFVYGLILWLANTFLVAPLLPGGDLVEDLSLTTLPAWSWSSGHLVFGVILGWLYAEWRRDRTTLVR